MIFKQHDGNGLPVHFDLSGAQVHDIIYAEKRVNKSPNNSFNLAKIDIEVLNDGYLYTYDISKDGK